MAELAIAVGGAFLSASLQVLFDKLSSPLLQEIGSLLGARDNLKKLSNTVLKIQAIVAKVDERQLLKDPTLSIWWRELKDVAYDAEDVLDLFATELLRKKAESGILSSINIPDGGRIDKAIDGIQSKLKAIAQEWDALRLEQLYHGINCSSHIKEMPRGELETSSLTVNGKVVGRAVETEEIVRLLLACNISNESDGCLDRKLPVLPIIGMGGLGKTTLAQLVYHDQRIEEQFDLKMWVWVSEEFDVKRITRGMLESSGNVSVAEIGSLDVLQSKLANRLKGKRFLLVLDDVWNEDHSQWCQLQSPLFMGNKGSMVLVTTRNKGVADAMQSMQPMYLECLPLKYCWSIFKHCVFAEGNHADVPPKLEAIGREIVKKAGGVPLAVKTLGRFLYCEAEERRWRTILEADSWTLSQGQNGILPSLTRSYHNLPSHLKRCFAYLSLFPKNYVFEKEALVQMWLAQGFILEAPAGQSREEAGSDYFSELVHRSLLMPSATGYVMHDLLHDLSKIVSADECLSVERKELHNSCANDQWIRHLSFSSHFRFEALYNFKKARTLMNLYRTNQCGNSVKLSNWPLQTDLDELLDKLKLLRTLDLSYSQIFLVPESIGSLKHLRYLDLSNVFMKKLPSSSCRLYNLQTLRLKECILLERLPRGICKLFNLRHLVADARLVSAINNIGKLTSLQELEVFRVSKDKGCKIEELTHMNELRGRLRIQNLQNIKGRKEAKPGVLKKKLHLHALELEWHYDRNLCDTRDPMVDQEILQSLEPPPNLTDISIKSYGGQEFPNWTSIGSIRNLESIRIDKCKKVKSLPCLGELPFLKQLFIKGMDSINCIGIEFAGSGKVSFPLLEELEFHDLPEWVEWWMAAEGCHFPCLNKLVMESCPKLKSCSLPLSTQLRTLQIGGSPGVLNKFLFTMLQNQNSLSFSMKISSPSLASCVKEVLLYLTALKVLKVQYCEKDMSSPFTNQKDPITLTYCLSPDEDANYSSEAELEIFGSYCNVNGSENDNGINLLLECLVDSFTLLSSLFIQGCPNVSSLHLEKVLPHLRLLEELEISSSKAMPGLNWLHESLESLKVLRFEDCPDLVCLPREALRHQTSLEKLSIEGCGELKFPELQALISLKSMWIERCPKLMDDISSSMLQLQNIYCSSSLQSLTIDDTSLLSARLTHNYSTLQTITILRCSHLETFSKEEEEGLQGVPSLKHLEFTDCPNLQHLPTELHKLSALKSLLILYCPLVQSLPSLGLPSTLERLEITECPILIKRCQKEKGSDWSLISHIPEIKMYLKEATTKELL